MTAPDTALTASAELELLRAVTIVAAAINRLIRARDTFGSPLRRAENAEPDSVPGLTSEDQDAASRLNVDEEISLLRYFMQRVLTRREEYDTPKRTAAMLRALAYANTTLTSLVRTQKKLTSVRSPLTRLLKELNDHTRRIESGEFDE